LNAPDAIAPHLVIECARLRRVQPGLQVPCGDYVTKAARSIIICAAEELVAPFGLDLFHRNADAVRQDDVRVEQCEIRVVRAHGVLVQETRDHTVCLSNGLRGHALARRTYRIANGDAEQTAPPASLQIV
jgi:hypothetical protein